MGVDRSGADVGASVFDAPARKLVRETNNHTVDALVREERITTEPRPHQLAPVGTDRRQKKRHIFKASHFDEAPGGTSDAQRASAMKWLIDAHRAVACALGKVRQTLGQRSRRVLPRYGSMFVQRGRPWSKSIRYSALETNLRIHEQRGAATRSLSHTLPCNFSHLRAPPEVIIQTFPPPSRGFLDLKICL